MTNYYSNLTSHSLRKLTRIVERRDNLLEELQKINTQIAEILGNQATAPANFTKGLSSNKKDQTTSTKSAKSGKRTRRSDLREVVITILKTAGPEGMRVKDIAKQIQMKSQNLSVWFSSTGLKIPGVYRIERGVYGIETTPTLHQPPQTSVTPQPAAPQMTSESTPSAPTTLSPWANQS